MKAATCATPGFASVGSWCRFTNSVYAVTVIFGGRSTTRYDDMALTLRDHLKHTYGEYLTWSDDRREELIDGLAYIKEPPAPSRPHQELVGELYYQLRAALEGKSCHVYMASCDVR